MSTEHFAKRSHDQIDDNNFAKRSHDQIDDNIGPRESSLNSRKKLHEQPDTWIAADESRQAKETPGEPTYPGRKVCRKGNRNQFKVETEVEGSSKRPVFDERRLLDRSDFDYTQRQNPPYEATTTFFTQEPTLSNYDDDTSRSSINFYQRRLWDPKGHVTRQWRPTPCKAFPISRISNMSPSKPNNATRSRPSFDQLVADGQQGMKVLFFVDKATRGDAIHHNIQGFVGDTSPEMRLLVSKYRTDRSSFQNRFVVKARTICAQLTSRHEFLEMNGFENDRSGRLAYFGGQCTKAYLSTLYRHIASAVDIPKILAARTRNEKAFKALMTQVFIHSMEDLWCSEFHPSKRSLSAKLKKENREDVYNRFKNLTDPVNGLPAARTIPGYLEVPLRASFPQYVFLNQGLRVRNGENINGMSEEDNNKDDRRDISHP